MIRVFKRRTVSKTASYTVSSNKGDHSGTLFTTRGAGAPVVFTLPTPQPSMVETWYEFLGVADQTFTVATASGKALALNNAAATSLAASTAGQKIGACIRAHCDGVSWILTGMGTGFTYTVA